MNKRQKDIEDKINILNLTAHLEVLKSDLHKKEEQLSEVSSESVRVKEETARIRKGLEQDILNFIAAQEKLFYNVRLSKENLDKILKEEQISAQKVSEKEEKLEKTRQLIKRLGNDRTKQIEQLDIFIEDLQNRKNTIEKRYIEAKVVLENRISEMGGEVSEIEDNKIKLENEAQSLAKSINDLETKKETLNDEIVSMIESKSHMDSLLTEREKAVRQRERDADALIARIRKVYREIYPNVEIKI